MQHVYPTKSYIVFTFMLCLSVIISLFRLMNTLLSLTSSTEKQIKVNPKTAIHFKHVSMACLYAQTYCISLYAFCTFYIDGEYWVVFRILC